MTAAGRKPKLADLTVIGGANYVDKKTRAKMEKRPKPDKFPFKMPPGMSASQKKHWAYLESVLAKTGRYGLDDIDEIYDMALMREEYYRLRKVVNKGGIMIEVKPSSKQEDANGKLVTIPATKKVNPDYKELQSVRTKYRAMLYEHGMTPLGRVKLGISPDGGGPLDEIEDENPANKYF